MAVVHVRAVSKSFRIPRVRRDTVREHALDFFRPHPFDIYTVLRSVSFDVPAGQSLGIMGRNGSGKSTLLKILTGIYQADSGDVTIQGPITPILELGIGWNPDLDALDNISLLGLTMGLSLAQVRASTDEILAFAELERFANMKLKHYSSGMAARLAYAVAFSAVRGTLILDEVFSVGDAGFNQRCEDRYRTIHDEGHTIVLVSHDPKTISEFCERALLLEGGHVIMDGPGIEVAQHYQRLLTDHRGTKAVEAP